MPRLSIRIAVATDWFIAAYVGNGSDLKSEANANTKSEAGHNIHWVVF